MGKTNKKKAVTTKEPRVDLSAKAKPILQASVDSGECAGANLLILQDGKEIAYAEAGLARIEDRAPIRRDTIFRLYSQTKPVTAAAAMLLLERGLIDLNDSLSQYLPAYKNARILEKGKLVEPATPIRLVDLMNMTSGLCYEDDCTPAGLQTGALFDELESRIRTDNPMTTREVADRLADCVLDFAPGTNFRYGTSADVMGAVIEVVSGKKFSEFLQDEFFGPLGMEDTAFYVPREKQSRLAQAYRTVEEEGGKVRLEPFDWNHLGILQNMDTPPAFESGGAGLASTLDDYAKFAQMLLNGGTYKGRRYLKPATIAFMTRVSEDRGQNMTRSGLLSGLPGYDYRNFLRICTDPAQALTLAAKGEYGWDGWLGVYFANLPKQKITILMGTQKIDAGTFALTRKLRNAMLSELL